MGQIMEGAQGTGAAQWLRLDEAAAALKLSLPAARAAARRGQLPAVRLGREWRVLLTALQPGAMGRGGEG